MISLTPSQNRLAAAALTALSLAIVLAFVGAVGWAAVQFLHLAAPALMPVVLGLFLAMLFKPYYEWILGKVHNPTCAFVLMALSVLVPLGIVCWASGAFLVEQVTHLMQAAPAVVTRFSAWINATFPNAHPFLASLGLPQEALAFFTAPEKFAQNLLSLSASEYGLSAVKAGVGALKYLSALGTLLLSLLFFVFFLMRPTVTGAGCVQHLAFLKPETRAFVAAQVDAFIGILVSFFQRQVVICLIEGVLYGFGFMLVGLPYGLVLGFLLGTVNLVPLLGTILILPLALPIAFFGDGGSMWRLVGVSTVWFIGQLLDGYLITPKIQGDGTGLGFAGVIFSFLFWGVVFQSLFGLLLAIPLSAFCVVLWRAVKARYVREVI